MRWHVTYTISMGKHGNQRVTIPFEGTEGEIVAMIDRVGQSPSGFVWEPVARKAIPVKNILLIEWSESK